MKKIVALFLVVSMAVINCRTVQSTSSGVEFTPQAKEGEYLYIQSRNGSRIEGELIAVKKTSMLLKDSETGIDTNIEVGTVETITVLKHSKALKMGGIGLLTGATGGALLGYAGGDDNSGIMSFTAREKAIIFGTFLGVLLGLLGAISGATQGIDQKIHVEGKTDSEIQEILDDLRKKSRVPDFQ